MINQFFAGNIHVFLINIQLRRRFLSNLIPEALPLVSDICSVRDIARDNRSWSRHDTPRRCGNARIRQRAPRAMQLRGLRIPAAVNPSALALFLLAFISRSSGQRSHGLAWMPIYSRPPARPLARLGWSSALCLHTARNMSNLTRLP